MAGNPSMLLEPVQVLEANDQELRLAASRSGTCAKCSLKGGCGQYLLATCREPELRFPVRLLRQGPGETVNPGQRLLLGISGTALARLALCFYGLPLGGLLLATLAASQLGGNEAWLAISAFAGLGFGMKLLPAVLATVTRHQSCSLELQGPAPETTKPEFNNGS